MDPSEEKMFILICDISGYTSFMVKNQMDYTHGVLIVKDLLDSLIEEIKLPMQISKIEGDAIFFYLLEDHLPEEFKKDPLLLGEKILSFYNSVLLET